MVETGGYTYDEEAINNGTGSSDGCIAADRMRQQR